MQSHSQLFDEYFWKELGKGKLLVNAFANAKTDSMAKNFWKYEITGKPESITKLYGVLDWTLDQGCHF